MNTTHTAATANRIHPLMAIAAGSVIVVCLAGTAAITGLLPNSKATVPAGAPAVLASNASQFAALAPGATTPAGYAASTANGLSAPVATPAALAAPAPVAYAPAGQQYALVPVQATPVALQAVPAAAPAPAPQKVITKTRVVHHYTQVARNDSRYDERRYSQPVRAPQAQPVNYLGVGAGALVGGLIGNQVGGGNGKKLATVAGVIGGGYLGNEIANRQYGR